MSYTVEQLQTAVMAAVEQERARCIAVIEDRAQKCLEKWGPIIGEDRAKARAFDILLASKWIASTSISSETQDLKP